MLRVNLRPQEGICSVLHRIAPKKLSVTRGRALCCSAAKTSRRELLAATVSLCPLVDLAAAHAEDVASPQQYIDAEDSFTLSPPAGWTQTETTLDGNSSFTGSTGGRRTLIWYSPDVPADELNVTLTITNTSVEFTKLGSFGNVYTFGQNLVNSMDQRFLLRVRGNAGLSGPVQVARLEDAAESRGMYYVEYTIEKVPGPKRHLFSLVALAYNGRYNRLYTLTAQCLEEQQEQAGPVLKRILNSFVPPAGVA